MPAQETFLDREVAGSRVQVVKTYDREYAREVFGMMATSAKAYLWRSLGMDESYDAADMPEDPGDRDEFLLDEMLSSGREDWKSFSYFVVLQTFDGEPSPTFVCSDWPSAEAFANAEPPNPLADIERVPVRNDPSPTM